MLASISASMDCWNIGISGDFAGLGKLYIVAVVVMIEDSILRCYKGGLRFSRGDLLASE